MSLQASTIERPDGVIQMLLNTTTDQRGSVRIPNKFGEGTPLAALAAAMYVGIAGGNVTIATGSKEFLPEILNDRLRLSLPPIVRGPLNNFRNGIAAYHVQTQRLINELATPGPATTTQQAIWDRAIRKFDNAATSAARLTFAMGCSLDRMTGLYVAGCFDDLPDDTIRIVMDRYLTLRFAAREGLAAKYPIVATADNPVSISTDQDAVMAEAKNFVGALRNREKLVDQAINICRDVIVWLAVALQCSTDEAFSILAKTNNN